MLSNIKKGVDPNKVVDVVELTVTDVAAEAILLEAAKQLVPILEQFNNKKKWSKFIKDVKEAIKIVESYDDDEE